MEIIKKTVGILAANCYVLRNREEAIVIDPGGNPELIIPLISRRKLVYIINTHGHYDHIAGNNPLKAHYDTKLLVSEDDHTMLFNPQLNLSVMVGTPFISITPDVLLHDGDRIEFDNQTLEVLHTPGHTKGSICIRVGNNLFSGDTLFFHSVGRTDLPGGSLADLRRSITTRLYSLPEETRVHTGHGEDTTIGEEKQYNEFVRG